jgi:hypothetical protein
VIRVRSGRFVRLLVASGALACSGGAEGDAALPEVQPICDGSDDVRLTFAAPGGFFSRSPFSQRYGSVSLAIDGRCSYWIADESLRGLRVGTIDAASAAVLSRELHSGRYQTAEGYRPNAACSDDVPRFLSDSTGTIQQYACGNEAAPPVVAESFERAQRLMVELASGATPAWSPTRVLAVKDPDLVDGPVFAWPAFELAARAVSQRDIAYTVPPGAGVLVEDSATLAQLTELRLAALDSNEYAADLLVESSEQRYRVFLRDEPPEAVTLAVQRTLSLP